MGDSFNEYVRHHDAHLILEIKGPNETGVDYYTIVASCKGCGGPSTTFKMDKAQMPKDNFPFVERQQKFEYRVIQDDCKNLVYTSDKPVHIEKIKK